MNRSAALLVLVVLLSLVGCSKGLNEERFSDEGIAIPCENGSYCIYIENVGLTEIRLGTDEDIFSGISVGDKIRIVHGSIAESYPAQTTAYSVEKVADGSIEDVSEDILSDLESLGRTVKE